MNNPRFIQVSSELEHQFLLVCQRYFLRAFAGGLLEARGRWTIGARHERAGQWHAVCDIDSQPISPGELSES